MREWAKRIKRDAFALWIAARDPRTPVVARMIAFATAAYAFSPIDLIPDFIPVVGLLDDVIIVPLGLWLALRLIPTELMDEYRVSASRLADRPTSTGAAVFVVAIWLGFVALVSAFFL